MLLDCNLKTANISSTPLADKKLSNLYLVLFKDPLKRFLSSQHFQILKNTGYYVIDVV